MGSAHPQALEILNKPVIAGAISRSALRKERSELCYPDLIYSPEFQVFALHPSRGTPHYGWQVADILRAGRGISREFGHDARPLRGAGGFKGCERGGHQERLSPAREKIAPGCQQARSQSCHALLRA